MTVAPLSISIRRLTPLIERDDPEMAVARHADAQLLAGDLLVVEAKLVGEAGQLRLIGRLLQQDEDEEGEQAGGKGKADDAADEGSALKQHDQQRRADRVDREMLPFGSGGRHVASISVPIRASGSSAANRYPGETLGTSAALGAFLT